ncbi:hypothetical protein [Parasitella parasitica]|uniref:Mid2 domain-containing protein n=1 Tax=Parasitella parasitica TaxID=35722 RepID=A0A0B7NSI5_9FUNG|nr:hypothetical protein [Parasitella parasitica]
MKFLSITKLLICVLLVVQFGVHLAHAQSNATDSSTSRSGKDASAQQVDSSSSAIVPDDTSADQSTAVPTLTTEAPVPTATTEAPTTTTTTTTEPPATTANPTSEQPSSTEQVPTTTEAPTASNPASTPSNAPPTSSSSSESPSAVPSSSTIQSSSSSSNSHQISKSASTSIDPSTTPSSSSAPVASSSETPKTTEGSENNKTGVIAGSVVGGVVGLALIGGFLAWMNRRGGCTSRTKNNRNGLSQDDYTIDMHQNDFNHGPTVAAAGILGNTATHASTDPLSPSNNSHRYAAAPAMYGASNVEHYGDYQEAYSQADYSQGGYSQGGYSQDGGYNHDNYNIGYSQQPDYAYSNEGVNYPIAGARGAGAGYDSNRHEINNADIYANNNYDQSKLYSDITSPTSAGNLSEGYSSVDKPNVKDSDSKPNEI